MPHGSQLAHGRQSVKPKPRAGEEAERRCRAGLAQRTGRARVRAGRARLEVTLAVQRRGEGHVVQSTGHSVGAGVGGHSRDAVLGLVRRQLSAQLVHRDVVLRGECAQGGRKARRSGTSLRR